LLIVFSMVMAVPWWTVLCQCIYRVK